MTADTTRPATAHQREVWLRHRIDPTTGLATTRAVRLRGPLLPDRLRAALDEVCAAYPDLHADLVLVGDDARLRPAPPEPVRLDVLSPDEAAGSTSDTAATRGVRARLVRHGPTDHVLTLATAPWALSGAGLGTLFETVLSTYAGAPAGPGAGGPTSEGAGRVPRQRIAPAAERLHEPGTTAPTDPPDAHRLDLGRPAPHPGGPGRWTDVPLPHGVAAGLLALAEAGGAGRSAVLAAAVAWTLHRYTGDGTVDVTVPGATAGRPDTAGQVVRRLRPAAASTVGELVDHAHRSLRASQGPVPSPDLPPTVLLETDELLGAPAGLAADVALGLAGPSVRFGDLRVEARHAPAQPVPADLTVRARLGAGPDAVVVRLGCRADLPEQLVRDLGTDLARVLAAMPAGGHTPVAGLLPVPAVAGRRPPLRLPHTGPPDHRPVSPEALDAGVPARFREQVRRHPDRIAVHGDDAVLTYRELGGAAAGVAAELDRVTGRRRGRVGLLLDHGTATVAAILGTLTAGDSYVPLDPGYPAARLAAMLGGAVAVLTTPEHRRLASEALSAAGIPDTPVVDVSALPTSGEPAVLVADPDAEAYVLYTSGSTGQPKGVTQTQRNLMFQVSTHTNNLRIGPSDRVSLLTSFGFDMAVTDMFSALLNGATSVPVDVRGRGLGHLAAALVDRQVTVYHSTPTLYRQLLDVPAGAAGRLRRIRAVVLGGEETTRQDVLRCRERIGPHCVFVNGYGATEISFAVQNHLAGDDELPDTATVPIGRPLDGVSVDLLDADGGVLGLTGEIGIRSRHLTPGYQGGDPVWNASRFLTHPDGTRTYRTGDLGRRLPDGGFAYLGRLDRQVKVRGYRVEPGEVEARLRARPEVALAVAAAVDGPAGKELLAWVTPSDDGTPEPATLRRALAAELPHYLVPQRVVVLPGFPLTSTGKVDVKALPVPPAADADVPAPPRTPQERAVVDAWRAVSDGRPLGVEQNFFDAGAHSLHLARLQQELERALGRPVPLVSLFAHPNAAALGAHLAGAVTDPARLARDRMAARRRRTS
ncbi:amino acid adenylation domain-containing protein [Micromonospora sediminicola]|uniref:amino acid adenylation domain-containing protein n=1 Tax=Micromonospora sediminicola TaxID=946078 RepID=UPI003409845C